MKFDSIRLRQNLLMGISLLTFFVLVTISNFANNAPAQEIIQCTVKNLDGEIQINWQLLAEVESVEVAIIGENFALREIFSADEKQYSFRSGEHGKGYDISVEAKNGEEILGKAETRAVFLDYDKVPNLPIIYIDSRNHKHPHYKMANKPEGLLGETSINTDYLECEMKMTKNGVKIADSRAEFRVRGNTSVGLPNKPYKLELKSAADLLELGNIYADREWLLLNQGYSLNTYFATELGNLFGIEWQPRIRYVNLVINGKWEGCYILSESIRRSPHRVNITHSGYIFEYDPYFWRPNTTYFRTTNTIKFFGYTFKYPKEQNLSRNDINNLKRYLQEFEDLLAEKNEHYADYLDVESCATWMIVHDILGTLDGAGSNMYFYKYDFDLENPTSTKMKRGPLWDFDSSFMILDNWSKLHYDANYMKQLFELESFQQVYKNKFYSLKDNILPNLKADSEDFKSMHLDDLQSSWNLHSARWNVAPADVEANFKFRLDAVQNKINWIDKKITANDWM